MTHSIKIKKTFTSEEQNIFSAGKEEAPSTLLKPDKSLEGLVLINTQSVSETLQGLWSFQGLSMDLLKTDTDSFILAAKFKANTHL